MKKFLSQFQGEDWVIVLAGTIVIALACLFPGLMPTMPKVLSAQADWVNAGSMYVLITLITLGSNILLKRSLKGVTLSLFVIFAMAVGAQLIAELPAIKGLGLEVVLFSVLIGLIISNVFRVPEWLKPAIQSEFYIKIGIICLGSTILIGDVLKSGAFGLVQSLIVVFTVWNFTFWLGKKMGVDNELRTMLSSAVSICGVSAAIATCGVIKGDSKKLSSVISLVLVCAIPMMYIMPPLANWLTHLVGLGEVSGQEVAGAWLGGTIDTTGAVAASGTMLGDVAAQTAIIVKSSQNVLLGVAAFFISIIWTYQGKEQQEKPTVGVIWDRFPKFVVGFIVASLVFSFCFAPEAAKSVGKLTKSMTNTLFGIAFVCIGLETRFSEIFAKENRKQMYVFLIAQGFNILVTLVVAYVMFGWLKPMMIA
ncbi:MAG: putative sulfate exporter family transporter [Rikenellaceae bacterium]